MNFKEFNQLYRESQFDEALGWLQKNKEEMDSFVYRYNLGVVYAKKQDLPRARFSFEKAKSEIFFDSSLNHNLSSVVQKMGLTAIENPGRWQDYPYYLNTLVPQSFVWVVAFVLASIFLVIARKASKLRLIIGSFVILSFGGAKFLIDSIYPQYIFIEEVKMYEGPSALFDTGRTIPAGAKVMAFKKDESWAKIVYPEGFVSWIMIDDKNIKDL